MAEDPKKPEEVTETPADTETPAAAQGEPAAPAKEVSELERKGAPEGESEPKAAPKKKAAPKAKAETKPKAEGKAKAEPKAKAESKPKAEGKAKAEPKAKTESEPKAKTEAAAATATRTAPARRNGRGGEPAVLVRAQAKYVRSSARKARLVCDAIRGKDVAQARAILAFHPRAVAEAWEKLLESAIANAENNHDLDGDDLRVHSVFADEGPTIKRYRPRAMGRATRIRKRTSHLTIQLAPKETR